MRIALVDDSVNDRKELRRLLEQYADGKQELLELKEYEDGEDFVRDYRPDYDLIILDIEMAYMNGMEAARTIRRMDEQVPLIFVTNMPQYAIEGYKVRAMDYLLKPVSFFAMSETVSRALSLRRSSVKHYITVAVAGGMKKIDTSRIRYVEVRDHDLIYHMQNGELSTRGSIQEAARQLEGDTFFQCSRWYLVNLAYVDHYQNGDIRIGTDIVRVSRGRKKDFLDALNRYFNNGSMQ